MLALSYQLDVQRRAARPTEDLEALRGLAHTWALEANLGFSTWFTLGVAVPFVYRTQQVTLGSGEVGRDAGGPGDPVLLARVTVLGARAAGPDAPRLTLLAGLKLPLGSHGLVDDHGPLPPGLEPGTGAADLLGGATFSCGVARRTLLHANALYRWTTADPGGYRLGDTAAVAALASVSHLRPVTLAAGLRFVWAGVDRLNGETQHASGGSQLIGQVSAVYHARASLFFGVDLRGALWQGLHQSPLATVLSVVWSAGHVF